MRSDSAQQNTASRGTTPAGFMFHTGRILVYGFLGLYGLFFLYCVFQRIMYPFELEWIEGEILCHIVRLLEGNPVYAPPSTAFISEIYPPVYYLISAALCAIFEISYAVPRLVSCAACLGVLYLLYRIPVQEGGTPAGGLLTSGLFVSLYAIHGTWYDVARVDMLMFGLLLAGCYVLAYYRARRWAAPVAALCFVLACYTKQPAVMFLPFAALYLLSVDKRAGILFSGLVSLGMLALFFWLHSATDGWFTTFTIVTPLGYNESMANTMPNVYSELVAQIQARLIGQMRYELFYELPIFFTLLSALVLIRIVSLKRPYGFSIWEYTLIPAVLTYFLIRPNVGTEKNDFMYITLWGCIALGCAFTRLCAGAGLPDKRTVLTVLYWLLGVQLALQLYNPTDCIPAPGSARKGHEFISMVRAMPGEVYIPYHAMYGVMAGKEMIFNAGVFWGYQMLSPEGYTPTDLIEKINRKHFSAIIIDEKSYLVMLGQKLEFDNVRLLLSAQEPLSQAIAQNYQLGYRIPYESSRQFLTVTGFFTRPELVLVPQTS